MPPATAASKRRSTPAVGGLEQLDADVGEQLLVGGDDRLAAGQRRRDQLAGRLDAADDLDDEVDVGVGDDVVGVAGEHARTELDVAVARQVAHGDPGDLQLDAGARLDLLGLGGHEADEGAADVAASEDPDANQVLCHGVRGYGSRRSPPSALTARPSCAGSSGSGMAVTEVDAHVARREDRVAVERHVLQPADGVAERHVVDVRRVEGDHHAGLALLQGAHRGGAEAQPEQAVERRRAAAAQQVAEHDGAGLLAGQLLEALGDDVADAAELLGLPDGLAEHRHATALRGRALGDDDDRELGAALLALGDRGGDRLELERDLRDQDGVGARRGTGAEGDPPGVAAHHLDDEHPAVRRRRREQAVDAVGGEAHRGVEAERRRRLVEVVVDRLGHADEAQARPRGGGWRSSSSRRRRR